MGNILTRSAKFIHLVHVAYTRSNRPLLADRDLVVSLQHKVAQNIRYQSIRRFQIEIFDGMVVCLENNQLVIVSDERRRQSFVDC